MHADVAKDSQGYLCDVRILCDRPRKSLSVTESVASRRHPEDLLRTFLKLPFSPSQVPGVVVSINGLCALRSTTNRTAF